MKITKVRTRVVEWRAEAAPLPSRLATNPMDLLELSAGSLESFKFHSWLIVEVESDAGLVGIGNAALSPRVANSGRCPSDGKESG